MKINYTYGMQIEVIKCNDSMLWYNNKVGQVFECIGAENREDAQALYWVRTRDEFNSTNFILVQDVEIK